MNAQEKAAHGRRILAYQAGRAGPDAAMARLVGRHMIEQSGEGRPSDDADTRYMKDERARVCLHRVSLKKFCSSCARRAKREGSDEPNNGGH